MAYDLWPMTCGLVTCGLVPYDLWLMTCGLVTCGLVTCGL
jgi:hypothetical protein